MAKIINFETFCYRRELKAMEKEIAERQRERINDLIGYARDTFTGGNDGRLPDKPDYE